jgi:hypothetical protein
MRACLTTPFGSVEEVESKRSECKWRGEMGWASGDKGGNVVEVWWDAISITRAMPHAYSGTARSSTTLSLQRRMLSKSTTLYGLKSAVRNLFIHLVTCTPFAHTVLRMKYCCTEYHCAVADSRHHYASPMLFIVITT